MSTSLLTDRLRSLERDSVIISVAGPRGRGRRYYLTPAGKALAEVVLHMGSWGARGRIEPALRGAGTTPDCQRQVITYGL